MLKFRMVALTAALVAASSSAWAVSLASASIGSVKFQLIDLAPDDGLAPSLTFIDGENQTIISGWVDDSTRTTAGIPRTNESSVGWSSQLSGSAASPSADATASWSASSSGISLSGAAQGLGGKYTWDLTTGPASSGDYWLRNIKLSAHSYLTIEASYSLDAEASNAMPCLAETGCPVAGKYELAGASAGMSLAYNYLEDGLSVGYNRTAGDGVLAIARPFVQAGTIFWNAGKLSIQEFDQPGTDQAFHKDGVLTLAFMNASDVDQTANLRIGVSIWGEGNTLAIPEPSTAILYGIGLIALIGSARWKGSNDSTQRKAIASS